MVHQKVATNDAVALAARSRQWPLTKCPSSAVLAKIDEDHGWTEETFRRNLIAGGLEAVHDFGRWKIWKIGASFSGQLLQHREIADAFESESIDVALRKAKAWIRGRTTSYV